MIVIKSSVYINKPREEVWDFTQDYSKRSIWDIAVLNASVIQENPNRMVELKMKGGTRMTFVYKLDHRPERTTLTAKNIQSPIISSAAGSWNYEAINGRTLWTQINSIEVKKGFLIKMAVPLLKLMLVNQTKKAMKKAKKQIEQMEFASH